MIKLIDNYYIEVDGLNYSLRLDQPGTSKKGEPIIHDVTIGYYRNIRECVEKCLRHRINTKFQDNDYTLPEAIKELEKIETEIGELLNTIPATPI